MPVSPETLRTHLDYTAWAASRLLDAAAQLLPEELSRDFGTADKSVVGTLAHVFAADRVWISRIQGEAPDTTGDRYRDLDVRLGTSLRPST